MLANTMELLVAAQNGRYAVGAFNTYNLELTQAIFQAAIQNNSPVIIQLSATLFKEEFAEPLSAMVLSYAKKARIPISVHLDHARDLSLIAKCIELGYCSVMYDGSRMPFHENIAMTRTAAAMAHRAGIPLEGEFGALADEDNGVHRGDGGASPYTNPSVVSEFVAATNVDSLAIAIGNQHGYYEGRPSLDFERLRRIREATCVPLVLHGASGIPDTGLLRAIEEGICKVNVNTDLRVAYFVGMKHMLTRQFSDFPFVKTMGPVIAGVQEVVGAKMELFGSTSAASA